MTLKNVQERLKTLSEWSTWEGNGNVLKQDNIGYVLSDDYATSGLVYMVRGDGVTTVANLPKMMVEGSGSGGGILKTANDLSNSATSLMRSDLEGITPSTVVNIEDVVFAYNSKNWFVITEIASDNITYTIRYLQDFKPSVFAENPQVLFTNVNAPNGSGELNIARTSFTCFDGSVPTENQLLSNPFVLCFDDPNDTQSSAIARVMSFDSSTDIVTIAYKSSPHEIFEYNNVVGSIINHGQALGLYVFNNNVANNPVLEDTVVSSGLYTDTIALSLAAYIKDTAGADSVNGIIIDKDSARYLKRTDEADVPRLEIARLKDVSDSLSNFVNNVSLDATQPFITYDKGDGSTYTTNLSTFFDQRIPKNAGSSPTISISDNLSTGFTSQAVDLTNDRSGQVGAINNSNIVAYFKGGKAASSNNNATLAMVKQSDGTFSIHKIRNSATLGNSDVFSNVSSGTEILSRNEITAAVDSKIAGLGSNKGHIDNATLTGTYKVSSYTINGAGTGYARNDILVFDDTGTQERPFMVRVENVGNAGDILSFTLLNAGYYQMDSSGNVGLVGGSGTGANVTIVMSLRTNLSSVVSPASGDWVWVNEDETHGYDLSHYSYSGTAWIYDFSVAIVPTQPDNEWTTENERGEITLTNSVKTLINGSVRPSEKGSANGIAPLDNMAKLPDSYLSDNVLNGVQNANNAALKTNTITINGNTQQLGDNPVFTIDSGGGSGVSGVSSFNGATGSVSIGTSHTENTVALQDFFDPNDITVVAGGLINIPKLSKFSQRTIDAVDPLQGVIDGTNKVFTTKYSIRFTIELRIVHADGTATTLWDGGADSTRGDYTYSGDKITLNTAPLADDQIIGVSYVHEV